jgi:O-acetyl-ADP-ribose deacetylase (regulator of RNase III)
MQVVRGDITTVAVDAVVNAANQSLLGGGGVDGAIHRAAGPQLLEECRKIGGCPTGEARITKGYALPARFVIHTVGPVYRARPQDRELLASCYRNSLQVAAAHPIRSIAFPAISCGAYGYPIEDAGGIAVGTVAAFLREQKLPQKVLFVLFSKGDVDVYRSCLTRFDEALL